MGSRSSASPANAKKGQGSRLTLIAWSTSGLIVGPVLFTAAWFVLGFMSTGYSLWDIHVADYSWISQPISGLGLGNTAPYMNTAFIVSGLLVIIGSFGLASTVPAIAGRRRWLYAALLALHGAGTVISGAFTLESADLHFVGFLLALSPIAVFPLVGRRMPRTPPWGRLRSWMIWSSPMTLVLVVVFFATFDPTAVETGIAGLTQRLLVLELQAPFVGMGWLAMRRVTASRPKAAVG